MNAKELYDLAPFGALIRFSTNTPQPPARHKRKLADWKCENGTAFFTRKEPGKGRHQWDRDSFALTQFGMITFISQYGVDSAKTFEIERPAQEGAILARSMYAEERGDVEVDGICENENEALRRFGRSSSIRFWRVTNGQLLEWTPVRETVDA